MHAWADCAQNSITTLQEPFTIITLLCIALLQLLCNPICIITKKMSGMSLYDRLLSRICYAAIFHVVYFRRKGEKKCSNTRKYSFPLPLSTRPEPMCQPEYIILGDFNSILERFSQRPGIPPSPPPPWQGYSQIFCCFFICDYLKTIFQIKLVLNKRDFPGVSPGEIKPRVYR
jgi:hypothetical protein